MVDADLNLPGPKIDFVNGAFTEMTGYTLDDLAGKTPRILQGKDSNRKDASVLKEKLLKGESFSFDTVNYKKNGSSYNVRIKAFPVKDEKGRITHYGAIQEDITDKVEKIDYLQKFIDLQDNIIILTDGCNLQFANKRLLEFFGFKTVDEFKLYHNTIAERFIEDERFFNLTKVPEGKTWVETVKQLPHSKRVVSMLRYDFNIHAFSITVNSFNDKMDIVTFTNISQTILNQIRLHEKNIHDKLTNSLNREYFEQNYQNLIEQYSNEGEYFALAILDIDHFKSVNDTYGHDVGDEVLKKMVSVIKKFSRKDDILIRWGGEEFVMILKVQSEQSLQKALDNLRKIIQFETFDKAGRVTCSFGATIYKDGEDIETTIKRADNGLYTSKRTGRNKVTIC